MQILIPLYPFNAGKTWSKTKTWIFNHFFTQLEFSYTWQDGRDIAFVKDLKHLKGIAIESTRTFDLTPLSQCTDLSYLNLACRVSRIAQVDLSGLPLKTYLGEDCPELQSIYKCRSLRTITLSNYKRDNLQVFEGKNLERITIDGSRYLESLSGIEQLPNLKLVEIERCPNLKRAGESAFYSPHIKIYVDGERQ